MAKSMRSKSKRAFRRTKREEGVYAAAHAARLERLSAKLVAKVSEDKDGDQTMEGEEVEEAESGGEQSLDSGYHSFGVGAGYDLCHMAPAPTGVHENVVGGEKNLNNIEESYKPMAFMDLDEETTEGETNVPCRLMASSSLVYDKDGDIEMMELDSGHDADIEELHPLMSGSKLAMGIEAYEDTYEDAYTDVYADETYAVEDDGSSVRDGTESKLVTPEQPPVDNPEVWQQDEPLFPSGYEASPLRAAYPCVYPDRVASGADITYPNYPLFREDFWCAVMGRVGVYAPGDGLEVGE